MKKITLIFLLTLVFNISQAQQYDTLHYIFLGHIKVPENKVDYRVEELDYNYFSRIWLGGDILSETTLEYQYLEYIDGIFDVSNPSNCWAFGNHDLRNFNDLWLREITGRKTYFAHFEDGITTLVLNLAIAPDDCEKLDDQYKMIKNVLDTIQESDYLIVISHHCVWEGVPGLPPPGTYSHSNQVAWIANCFDNPASFVDLIYPGMIEVKNRGITVINIMGDTGSSNKGESMVSDDGIFFIASGINPNTEEEVGKDKVLIFDHIPETGWLTWKFHELDSLYLSFQ